MQHPCFNLSLSISYLSKIVAMNDRKFASLPELKRSKGAIKKMPMNEERDCFIGVFLGCVVDLLFETDRGAFSHKINTARLSR